jgi:hypothetical protein
VELFPGFEKQLGLPRRIGKKQLTQLICCGSYDFINSVDKAAFKMIDRLS